MWSYMQSHMILSQRLLDAIRCDNLSFPLPWLRMLYCLGIIPAEEGGLRYVKECSGSVNRGFLLNRRRAKKKNPCICLGVVGEKTLVSSGAQVVSGKLTGAGHSHSQHELELQLQSIVGEPCESMAYCQCSIGIANQNRPSSRSYICSNLVILSII